MMAEPGNGLEKGLFLCKSIFGLPEVCPYRKSMCYSAEKIDLIWLTSFDENIFRLMAELASEDVIDF
jgi:hypothetical protein